jgi:hypothetical protein
VNNTELLAFVTAETQRLRALGSPAARFTASQLERTAVLLRFTGANTEAEFDDRIEANEESVKEEAYSRGYAEGRASFSDELAHGVLPN